MCGYNVFIPRLRFSVDGRLRTVYSQIYWCVLLVLANLWELFSHYMIGFVERFSYQGLRRPQCYERSPLSGVCPDLCGSVDPLLEAVLRTAGVAIPVPLVFHVTRMLRPLQIVRVVHVI